MCGTSMGGTGVGDGVWCACGAGAGVRRGRGLRQVFGGLPERFRERSQMAGNVKLPKPGCQESAQAGEFTAAPDR
ncbi:hypothetical protein GCM10022244_01980 [Streptomyces gulbargensis]|uniref:Uncharacterized protein n=1 Tax=Streptomyces gulbargensis TaxID=364901 RepID=A0ABP7L7V6_9ACTN